MREENCPYPSFLHKYFSLSPFLSSFFIRIIAFSSRKHRDTLPSAIKHPKIVSLLTHSPTSTFLHTRTLTHSHNQTLTHSLIRSLTRISTASASFEKNNSIMSSVNQSYQAYKLFLLTVVRNNSKHSFEPTHKSLQTQARLQHSSPSIMDRYWESNSQGQFYVTGQPSSVHQKEMTAKQHQRKIREYEWYYSQQKQSPSINDRFSKGDVYERSVATGQRNSRYQEGFQSKHYPRESRGYDGDYRQHTKSPSNMSRFSTGDAYEGSVATGQRRSGYQEEFQPKQHRREPREYDGYHRSY